MMSKPLSTGAIFTMAVIMPIKCIWICAIISVLTTLNIELEELVWCIILLELVYKTRVDELKLN